MTDAAFPQPAGHIRFNELTLPWHAGLTVAAVLAQQGVAPLSVATAVNGRFVARGQRADVALAQGDALTTFQAIVGG